MTNCRKFKINLSLEGNSSCCNGAPPEFCLDQNKSNTQIIHKYFYSNLRKITSFFYNPKRMWQKTGSCSESEKADEVSQITICARNKLTKIGKKNQRIKQKGEGIFYFVQYLFIRFN